MKSNGNKSQQYMIIIVKDNKQISNNIKKIWINKLVCKNKTNTENNK